MSETVYRLSVGDFKCLILNDGYLQDPGERFGLNILYIEAGNRKMLLDNGCGEMFQEGTAGHLLKNMKAAGIGPETIDTIIFDHGHLDHVCGTTDDKGRPVFPNARYIIAMQDWAYMEAGPTGDETQDNFFGPSRKFLLPLKERFDLVDDNYEVVPGIRYILAPGHTPGNSMIDITSQGGRLLSVGDVVHSESEFTEPGHCAAFDVDPEQAVKTRTKILGKLVKEGTLIFATHFAFPGLGHFRRKDGVVSWEPLR